MKKVQITLIGEPHRNYRIPVLPGDTIKLVKNKHNPCDNEAIEVHCLQGEEGAKLVQLKEDTMFGHVANSVKTKSNGTWSAGRLYDKISSSTQATVLFIKEGCCVAEVEVN